MQTDQHITRQIPETAVNPSSLTPPRSLSKAPKHANMVGYVGRSIICETNRVQPQIIRRSV